MIVPDTVKFIDNNFFHPNAPAPGKGVELYNRFQYVDYQYPYFVFDNALFDESNYHVIGKLQLGNVFSIGFNDSRVGAYLIEQDLIMQPMINTCYSVMNNYVSVVVQDFVKHNLDILYNDYYFELKFDHIKNTLIKLPYSGTNYFDPQTHRIAATKCSPVKHINTNRVHYPLDDFYDVRLGTQNVGVKYGIKISGDECEFPKGEEFTFAKRKPKYLSVSRYMDFLVFGYELLTYFNNLPLSDGCTISLSKVQPKSEGFLLIEDVLSKKQYVTYQPCGQDKLFFLFEWRDDGKFYFTNDQYPVNYAVISGMEFIES